MIFLKPVTGKYDLVNFEFPLCAGSYTEHFTSINAFDFPKVLLDKYHCNTHFRNSTRHCGTTD